MHLAELYDHAVTVAATPRLHAPRSPKRRASRGECLALAEALHEHAKRVTGDALKLGREAQRNGAVLPAGRLRADSLMRVYRAAVAVTLTPEMLVLPTRVAEKGPQAEECLQLALCLRAYGAMLVEHASRLVHAVREETGARLDTKAIRLGRRLEAEQARRHDETGDWSRSELRRLASRASLHRR